MMTKGFSIAGRRHNDGIDYYQTPVTATEALLRKEKFNGIILEPCCGAGAISKVLIQNNYEVISSDVRTDDNVYGSKGIDIYSINEQVDNIITNPPYFIAQEIIEKSILLARYKVAMLLKLTFLESEKRKWFFNNHPPTKIYVFRKRVTMYPEGTDRPKNSGTVTFAWYVWYKEKEGNLPTIDWV